MDPETSEDEQPVPRRIAVAQKVITWIAVAQIFIGQKAAVRKAEFTRVTCSGVMLCQRRCKQKR